MANAEIIVDFQVLETHDPKYLMIGDVSQWAYAEKKPSYILITLPGSSTQHNWIFKKKGLNVVNSNNVGLSCVKTDCNDQQYVDLPDGIYTICVKSYYEGIEKTKYYLKTDRFEVEFKKTIIKTGTEYSENDRDFRETALQIRWYLEIAKGWAQNGDFVKADRYFNKAKGLLNRYRDCKDC